MTLPELLAQAQVLSSPEASTEDLQGLVDELLGRLLLAEGPPLEPVARLSEDFKQGIVRTPKGRPLAAARTWTTGPWRCLLLDSPSVPMGRPLFIPRDRETLRSKKVFSAADFRVITGSRTQGAIRRIVAACQSLEIAQPVGQGAVHAIFGEHRLFLSWRHRESDEGFNTALRGDVDNFSKTVLDGLQGAGVLPNDSGVFRLSAAKDLPQSWESPPPPLEDALRDEALARRARGEALETVRVEMRLSRAHMARLFPGEYKAPVRAKDPAIGAATARRAVELILAGTPYKQARKETGAPGVALRQDLAAALRPRMLLGELSLHELAEMLQLDTRSCAALFRGDADAQRALRANRKPRPPRAEASRALSLAVEDVRGQSLSVPAAARKHHVSQGSLRVRLSKEKAKSKRGHAGDG